MAARAPSLEIFEHLLSVGALDDAFAEACALLQSINMRHGRIDAIAWKASPVSVTESERLVEFATRICAGFGALVGDRLFNPGVETFAAFCGVKRWVDTLFRVSAFGSSANLLESIGRSAAGEAWCFEGSAPQRFLMAWSPESGLAIEPSEWLAGQGGFAVSAFLAHVGARVCLSPVASAFREKLLQTMGDDASVWQLERPHLDWIVEPYLHCSYACGPHKHAIKARLIGDVRRALLGFGCREMARRPQPRAAGEKPVILVTAEYFAQGHSVHRTHFRAIRGLRQRFRVIGFINADQRGAHMDECFDEIMEAPGGDIVSGARLAVDLILACRPDVVFHTGVGLSGRIIALAALRLAPLQCVSFGHTATTMSPQIDAFILPEDFIGSREAFSESVLGLPMEAFPYEPRAERHVTQDRASRSAVHIGVPASLPKLNAGLLTALGEIAARASKPVVFEFFPLGAAGLAGLDLTLALAAALPGAIAHREMSHELYLEALGRCDFFLSPFPYGNMNSILDAMEAGLPGVCLDGAEPHSHADAAYFHRLGLPCGWVARDVGGYIAAALAFVDSADCLGEARALVAGLDWRRIFCNGDETLLGQALLAELARRIDPAGRDP